MRKRLQTPALLAGILLAGLTSTAIAVPVPDSLQIFVKADAEAFGTVPTEVAAERGKLLEKFDSVQEETFSSAPYEAINDGGGTSIPKPLDGPIAVFGGGSLTLSGNPSSSLYFIDDPATGGSPVSGDWLGRFDTSSPACTPSNGDCRWFNANDNFSIAFGGNFSGFGFYATDAADFEGGLELELILANGDVVKGDALKPDVGGGSQNGGILFFGFFDAKNAYSGVNFLLSSPLSSDFVGFDNLVLGTASTDPNPTPMPEPGSLALVGLSLLGLAASRRRRA